MRKTGWVPLLFSSVIAFQAVAQDMNINVNVGGMDQDKPAQKADKKELKSITATFDGATVTLGDGRTIPVAYLKSQLPWSSVEVTEPVGAKVQIYSGDKLVHNDEIPFLWKEAKIGEYVKIVVVEGNVTWAFKLEAKKFHDVLIGHKGATASGPIKSKHFQVEKSVFRQGDAINVQFFDMPGNSQDWITVVPAGSANTEWGSWEYTGGKAGGVYALPTLGPGKYELRAYYNYPDGGFAIQDRLVITVK